MRRETGEGDAGLDSPVGVEHRLAQPIEGKAAAALPTQSLRNPALIAVHHLVQARREMGHGVLAHLDPDPAPPHLVRHRRGGAGDEQRVDNKNAGACGEVKDALDETLWYWSSEGFDNSE